MKMLISHISPFLAGAVIFSVAGHCQPSIHSSFMIGDENIFRDAKKTNLYYYTPFDYKLVTDVSGKPFFTLTQMRYTGKQSTGDAGTMKYNNLLQFKIAVDISQQKKVSALKTSLKAMNTTAELQMLPVRKFTSVLVFASSGEIAFPTTDSVGLIKVNLTEATDENAVINNSYWNERTVSLRLSNVDAELVESALRNNQSIMSFSYAVYTAFAEKTSPGISISGRGKLRKQVADYFQNEINTEKDTALRIALIKADAIGLGVDINKWPDAIQKIDINERVPARYALFDVYCYDFNNELRPDLYQKKIEIKATSVNGSAIITAYSFKQSRPDVYAKSIRFTYVVRLDKPFYYRVTEVDYNGEVIISEWIERKEWSEILDITSPPEKRIIKPIETEK